MKAKESLMIFVLLVILPRGISEKAEKARKEIYALKDLQDSFSSDIHSCLFEWWTPYVGPYKKYAVLKERVVCNKKQLCYGGDYKKEAQFAVCYNQTTLIPEFTGHIVKPNADGQGNEGSFREDSTVDPVAADADYRPDLQKGLYFNYNQQLEQFFARGHLTPNADFGDESQRTMTMITTNIAPQWQLFNGGNWEGLESGLRAYAKATNNALRVFTGTGGAAENLKGNVIWLNKRVQAPQYYWKAICDPFQKQSAFFWGENTIGDKQGNKDQTERCCDKLQTKKRGVICCSSLSDAKKNFKGIFQIPNFHEKNCVPSVLGKELKDSVIKKLQ